MIEASVRMTPLKPEIVAQQVGQQFGCDGRRQDVGVGDARAKLAGVFRQHDVADHDRLDPGADPPLPDLAVAGVPLLHRAVVVGGDDVLVAFVAAVAGKVLHAQRHRPVAGTLADAVALKASA